MARTGISLEEARSARGYSELPFCKGNPFERWYSDDIPTVFVYTPNFEARSMALVKKASRVFPETVKYVATPSISSEGGVFKENMSWTSKSDVECVATSGDEYAGVIEAILARDVATRHVAIDISAMSRRRLASAVSACYRAGAISTLRVDFLYAPVRFYEPPDQLPPIEVFGPVSADFASARIDVDLPLSLTMGLGYEPDRALGAFEYLEPSDIALFAASGTDPRFETAVRRQNVALIETVGAERVRWYPLQHPLSLLAELGSRIGGTARLVRPVIVPFGPRMFTLASLIVAADFAPEVSVWRVSADRREPRPNREGSGHYVGLTVRFSPTKSRLG